MFLIKLVLYIIRAGKAFLFCPLTACCFFKIQIFLGLINVVWLCQVIAGWINYLLKASNVLSTGDRFEKVGTIQISVARLTRR